MDKQRYENCNLWKRMEELERNPGILNNIKCQCNNVILLLTTIPNTFPQYTLHDETHICNMLNIIEDLLGEDGIIKLNVHEIEFLIMAVFYHDIGMCYSPEEKAEELKSHRFKSYLNKTPWADICVHENRDKGEIPECVQSDFFRSIHHERTAVFLNKVEDLTFLNKTMLMKVCRSHGEDIGVIKDWPFDSYYQVDYCFCAILLRLADILDFDMTRSPQILYEYRKVEKIGGQKSIIEWKKHQSSFGFRFPDKDREAGYELSFRAISKSMQVEHFIQQFLNYIDLELRNCSEILRRSNCPRWRDHILPGKVDRSEVQSDGYQTGEYHLNMDFDRVLELLTGDDLYTHPGVFIRELLQNSIDAIGTRKMLDQEFREEIEDRPLIEITTWMDCDGDVWFRIDDNGIGMTQEMVLEYFLKVGKSYYKSDEFRQICFRNKIFYDYKPISRFGIGILSCFLCGDLIEVSTRYYKNGKGIRFCMNGQGNYYSLSVDEEGHAGAPMPAIDEEGTYSFRQSPGTSIAVKVKLFQYGESRDIKTMVKDYVCYPAVPIVYRDNYETFEFPTAVQMAEEVEKNSSIRVPLSDKEMRIILDVLEDVHWIKTPEIVLECTDLKMYSKTDCISGANFSVFVQEDYEKDMDIMVGDIQVHRSVFTLLLLHEKNIEIFMYYDIFPEYPKESAFGRSIGQLEANIQVLISQYKQKSSIAARCGKLFEEGTCEKEHVIRELLRENPEMPPENIQDIVYKGANLYEGLWKIRSLEKKCVHLSIPLNRDKRLEQIINTYIMYQLSEKNQFMSGFTEVAYNGVFVNCGTNPWKKDGSRVNYTIVLLNKEFCPVLDISRERVKNFSMEAAGYLALLSRCLPGTYIDYGYSNYYADSSLKEFLVLLENKEYCKQAETVFFASSKKTIFDLEQKLKNGSQEELVSVGSLRFHDEFYDIDEPGKLILRALLQYKFELRCRRRERTGRLELYVTGFRDKPLTKEELLLPPLFCVEFEEEYQNILTEDDPMSRNSINKNHIFTRWLVGNVVELEKNYKGILNELLNHVKNSKPDVMITQINRILKKMERLNGKFRIPDEVYLKKSDFC